MALAVRATIGVCHPLPLSFRRIAAVASTPVPVAEDNPVIERSFGDAQISRLRRVPSGHAHAPVAFSYNPPTPTGRRYRPHSISLVE
jgi:hypothetical protein